ncbi:MAG: MoaD/ThiS family protein, partial [Anaerolineaceae bacterium]|nr:MoaD/ThiS family protein [Anaerolineaceae bacterium]
LPEQVVCAINRQLERNRQKPLQEGDEVRFFRPGAGG